MYWREAHDFIIWLRSIYLDIISNNYARYLSDIYKTPPLTDAPTRLHRKFTSGPVKLGDAFVKRGSAHGPKKAAA